MRVCNTLSCWLFDSSLQSQGARLTQKKRLWGTLMFEAGASPASWTSGIVMPDNPRELTNRVPVTLGYRSLGLLFSWKCPLTAPTWAQIEACFIQLLPESWSHVHVLAIVFLMLKTNEHSGVSDHAATHNLLNISSGNTWVCKERSLKLAILCQVAHI